VTIKNLIFKRMKKVYTFLFAVIMTVTIIAQSPDKMSYQAVIRSAGGSLIQNSPVGIKINILQGSTSGTVVFSETYTTSTNINGLLTVEIGTGTPGTGTFADINWSIGPYFLKTETDPDGGTNYSISATSQLLSVPYALQAKVAETASDAVKLTGNQTIAGNKSFTGTTTVPTPVNATDAATKAYVDALLQIINQLESQPGLVKDVDGNLYTTIKIGTQVWMGENLKTTKYNNGTAIPLVTENTAWANLITPGYCWYSNNEASYKDTYGALYNWYTVNTGNLCPAGWHVPTDAEWTTLENYLIVNGFNYDGTTTGNKIAKALASTSGWTSSSTTGAVGNTDYPSKRNATGYTALPCGNRSNSGAFSGPGSECNWWSATEYDASNAWYRNLVYSYSDVYRGNYFKKLGFSVRCIRE
jgi:uncharacterized protein (TIGR02145 family)